MTYDQFWNDDPMLVKYYRKAEKMRNDRKNSEMWLQGMYVYDAFGTVIHNLFRPKGEGAKHYTDKPYELDKKKSREETVEIERAKAEAWMINFVNFYKV